MEKLVQFTVATFFIAGAVCVADFGQGFMRGLFGADPYTWGAALGSNCHKLIPSGNKELPKDAPDPEA